MRFVDEFRDPEIIKTLTEKIRRVCRRKWTLMEFCGTHTVAIFRHGLKPLLPENLRLVSGPGCPVCVTGKTDIDRIIHLSTLSDSIMATYGDMMKVPGSEMNLTQRRALGGDVRVVYSSYDALDLARRNPDRRVFFAGVGFETTAPATAAALVRAEREGLRNFSVLSLHKATPPVVGALLSRGSAVNGFICPGHVCAIIGARPLEGLASAWKRPCVVAGFEAADVLQAIYMLVRQLEQGRSEVEVEYLRGVPYDGNPAALALMGEVFEPATAEWRGIGQVESSGLWLRPRYSQFDASRFIPEGLASRPDPPGCRCGDVLQGLLMPPECELFGKACTPEEPVGPCMVSGEGSCAAHYLYGGQSEWPK